MGLFGRNTSVEITQEPGRGWRVRNDAREVDQTIRGGRSARGSAKSQRRLEHKVNQGKTPRWAR
jgi:hypothetical protein